MTWQQPAGADLQWDNTARSGKAGLRIKNLAADVKVKSRSFVVFDVSFPQVKNKSKRGKRSRGDSGRMKELIVKTYKLPSGGMIPSLRIGDHIYVDNLIYGIGYTPERGNIIIFRFPEDEDKDFIKRVIGLPGIRFRSAIREERGLYTSRGI